MAVFSISRRTPGVHQRLTDADVVALVGEMPLLPSPRAFALAEFGDLKSDGASDTVSFLETRPLPSLTAAFSRRRTIFGAVALVAAPMISLPVLAASNADPADARLVALADAYEALDREVLATLSTDPGYEDLVDRYGPIEEDLVSTAAASMIGVLAKARAMQVPAARECAEPELGNSLADDLVRIMGGARG